MTTLATPRTSGSPILKVARVQLTNRQTFVWVPLLVWGGAFALTLAVWAAVYAATGPNTNLYAGSAQAPLWYLLVVGSQSVVYTFPFAQALSFTRRDFYLGTLLVYGLVSVVFGAAMWLFGALEGLTNGWWTGGHYATFEYLGEAGHPGYFVLYAISALMALNVGFCMGTIWKRGGTLALTTTLIAMVAVLIGVYFLVAKLDWWGGLATLLAPATAVWVISLIVAVIAAAAGFISWALIRRTPA
ncbi:hypothetical protein [Galactobacter caseinivorans]|uniref:Uncharacterized protein n=1 Tax=Galactobacter caseinivorans TaxID=2676123 RepID=A0A496PGJ9_9MICC|nr:hypothetical protein [Galactobacter caseinivorans]RKW69608.1 hypothetical protein DWQ67_12515 [Galactobacter caseinivorans]